MRRVLAAFLASAALASCHTWGFFRPVDLPLAERSDDSGLAWRDLRVGKGAPATDGARVRVHYTGKLAADGKQFDSSLDRGKPLEFVLGQGQVVRGWELGMVGMRAGGRREITIPPELAHGSQGRDGVIPPNATLVLEVELLELTQP